MEIAEKNIFLQLRDLVAKKIKGTSFFTIPIAVIVILLLLNIPFFISIISSLGKVLFSALSQTKSGWSSFYNGLLSVSSVLAAIATSTTLFLLWYDIHLKKGYEKQSLEIRKQAHRAWMIPIPIHSYLALNPDYVFHGRLERIDILADGKPARNFLRDIYNIKSGDMILAMQNIGKGIAIEIEAEICPNEQFKPHETVVEKVAHMKSESFFVIWKDPRYKACSFDFSKDFYTRITFRSGYINDQPKSILFKITVRTYFLKKKFGYYIHAISLLK